MLPPHPEAVDINEILVLCTMRTNCDSVLRDLNDVIDYLLIQGAHARKVGMFWTCLLAFQAVSQVCPNLFPRLPSRVVICLFFFWFLLACVHELVNNRALDQTFSKFEMAVSTDLASGHSVGPIRDDSYGVGMIVRSAHCCHLASRS
jgi:hypothetical protein